MATAGLDRPGILRRAKLFRSLSDPEILDLSQQCVVRRLRRNDSLAFAGENASGLLVLAEGSVRIFREGHDGREQVLRLEHAVTTLNELHLFDGGPHPASISACEDAVVLSFPFSHSRQKLLGSPRFAADALELMAERLRDAFELVHALSLHGVDQRLAQYLLGEAHRHGRKRPGGLSFELTQSNQQIGAMIGAVREVVSRSLTKLQAQDLIACHGRSVVIPNPEILARFAGIRRKSKQQARAVAV